MRRLIAPGAALALTSCATLAPLAQDPQTAASLKAVLREAAGLPDAPLVNAGIDALLALAAAKAAKAAHRPIQ